MTPHDHISNERLYPFSKRISGFNASGAKQKHKFLNAQ